MLKRFLLYGMPVYLLAAEQFIKAVMSDPWSFRGSGPNIAVAGVSLLIPAIIPKPTTIVMSQELRLAFAAQNTDPGRLRIRDRRDVLLTELATIAFFLLFAAWCITLYLSHSGAPIYAPMGIALGCYTVGIGFTEWKDRLR